MRYAIISDDSIVNVVVSEPDYAIKQGWVAIADSVNIGATWNGSEWVNLNPVVDGADSISADSVSA